MFNNRLPKANAKKVTNMYRDKTFPLVLLVALSFNQLSTMIRIPIMLKPVKNLAKVQIIGSTKTTWTKELKEAMEAKAANTLI